MQGVHYILNPYTGNAVAEVLYAGYDKLNDLLGGVLPLTGAGRANQEIIDIAIEQGGEVNSVNDSRGAMTWTNAMHDLDRQGLTLLPIGTVLYNGAAASAQEAADLLLDISKAGKMFQSTHFTDRVGEWIGRNPETGGKDDGSLLDSHSSYTGFLPPFGTFIETGDPGKYINLREITDRHWVRGTTANPYMWRPRNPRRRKKMAVRVVLPVLVLVLVGCRTGHLYPAEGSSAVLVQPTHRAWLKPDSTVEDQDRARRECGDELRNNLELRKKGLSDEWSDAAHACMNRKGFRYYKKR